MAQGL